MLAPAIFPLFYLIKTPQTIAIIGKAACLYRILNLILTRTVFKIGFFTFLIQTTVDRKKTR